METRTDFSTSQNPVALWLKNEIPASCFDKQRTPGCEAAGDLGTQNNIFRYRSPGKYSWKTITFFFLFFKEGK